MDIPRHWRLRNQRYCLTGEVCNYCDEKIFPPKGVCPACGGEGRLGVEAIDGKDDFSVDSFVTQAVLAKNPPERI